MARALLFKSPLNIFTSLDDGEENNFDFNSPTIFEYLTSSRMGLTKEPLRTKLYRECLLKSSKSLYFKNIIGHEGCVNAIEFSPNGHHLFSGGDDLRVRMWNVDTIMMGDNSKAKAIKLETPHTSNIFCISVHEDIHQVLSSGNDEQVVIHDYNVGKTVNSITTASPIFSIAPSSDNQMVFVTADDNGVILLYDLRVDTLRGSVIAKMQGAFGGVMFNPLESNLLATANYKLGFHGWDIRTPKKKLAEFYSEPGMAVRWNATGRRLLCFNTELPPVILDPLDSSNYIEFDSKYFYSSCTMKSGCFAGENDTYLLSGSDDFNVYMWEIPKASNQKRVINKEHMVLRGHRSIVNQVRYNPQNQLIATCGVEKVIKLWSPFKYPGSHGDNNARMPKSMSRSLCCYQSCRRINVRMFNSPPPGEDDTGEDYQMLHFFDTLIHDEMTKSKKQLDRLGKKGTCGCRSFYECPHNDKCYRRKRMRLKIFKKPPRWAVRCPVGMRLAEHDISTSQTRWRSVTVERHREVDLNPGRSAQSDEDDDISIAQQDEHADYEDSDVEDGNSDNVDLDTLFSSPPSSSSIDSADVEIISSLDGLRPKR